MVTFYNSRQIFHESPTRREDFNQLITLQSVHCFSVLLDGLKVDLSTNLSLKYGHVSSKL